MDKDELVEIYWRAYQTAASDRGVGVGELEDLDEWDREAMGDALEVVLREAANV